MEHLQLHSIRMAHNTYITINKELADFLGMNVDGIYNWVRVYQQMSSYIRDHKCSEEKCSKIYPNAPLMKLLRLKVGDELDHFNLGDKLKFHCTEILFPQRQTPDVTVSDKVSHVAISKEFSEFLGMDADAIYPRLSVYKKLNRYLKEHKCSEAHSSRIYPNAPLSKLLHLKDDDELTHATLLDKVESHFTEKTVI